MSRLPTCIPLSCLHRHSVFVRPGGGTPSRVSSYVGPCEMAMESVSAVLIAQERCWGGSSHVS